MELSADNYLSKFNLDIYLRDALKVILSNKEVNPIKSIFEYLVSVNFGYHIINRDYEYITLTGRNRISFIKMCYKAFIHIKKDENNYKLTLKDWHQLATLICPDFPYEFINQGGICFKSSFIQDKLVNNYEGMTLFPTNFLPPKNRGLTQLRLVYSAQVKIMIIIQKIHLHLVQ